MAACLRRTFQKVFIYQRPIQLISASRRFDTSVFLYSSDSAENVKTCKGINYMKEGTDPPLLPDSDYPDWLWKLAEPKKPLEELSQDTKEYWRRLNKIKRRQENMARKQKRF